MPATVSTVADAREPVLVIGAGVAGLTSGVVLAEAGHAVRIRSAELPAETTSNAAGAMWGPALLHPRDRVLDWVNRAHADFVDLAEQSGTGVHLCGGRMVSRADLGASVPPETARIPDMRRCEPAELPAGFVTGYYASVPLVDMPRYLGYLVTRFRAAGGELLRSPVPMLADAVAESSIVLNCAGTGARMFGDPTVVPMLGQTVVVPNPGIDEYLIELAAEEEFLALMPHGDRLVLGGIAVEHEWSMDPDAARTERILARCAQVEPLLREARPVDVRVGLRPTRTQVRVETEEYRGAHVVHNYGHGGSGVALSWGCAREVASLVTDLVG